MQTDPSLAQDPITAFTEAVNEVMRQNATHPDYPEAVVILPVYASASKAARTQSGIIRKRMPTDDIDATNMQLAILEAITGLSYGFSRGIRAAVIPPEHLNEEKAGPTQQGTEAGRS